MKYWCENCKTEYHYPDKFGEIHRCLECHVLENKHIDLKPIPKYETVAQWETRTGKKYHDTAPVYIAYASDKTEYEFFCAYWAWGRSQIKKEPNIIILVATEAGFSLEDWFCWKGYILAEEPK